MTKTVSSGEEEEEEEEGRLESTVLSALAYVTLRRGLDCDGHGLLLLLLIVLKLRGGF